MGISVLDLSSYVGLVAVAARDLEHGPRHNDGLSLQSCSFLAASKIQLFPSAQLAGVRRACCISTCTRRYCYSIKPAFRIRDLVFQCIRRGQPLENTVRAVALYLLAFVVITSYFRLRLGRRLWKAFHFGIYIVALPLFFHSLLTDPNLKNSVDWLDGGKVFVELALLLIVVITVLRFSKARVHL
jgi:hypothetical protein